MNNYYIYISFSSFLVILLFLLTLNWLWLLRYLVLRYLVFRYLCFSFRLLFSLVLLLLSESFRLLLYRSIVLLFKFGGIFVKLLWLYILLLIWLRWAARSLSDFLIERGGGEARVVEIEGFS